VLNYTGFFDESGTDENSKVIVVGGYVSPARSWRRLEIKWKKRLTKENVPYYHTTDIEGFPPRGIYKGWSRQRADRLTDGLVPLLKDHIEWGFAVYLLREDWNGVIQAARQVYAPHEIKKFPYVLLSKMCIEGLVLFWGDQLPKGEKIGFVFERNDCSGKIVDGYTALAKRPTYAPRCGTIQIGDNKQNFPGLQAADLLAWHYRRFIEQREGYRSENHRLTEKTLLPNMELRYIRKAALIEQFKRLLNAA
jgi:hypothetical protein